MRKPLHFKPRPGDEFGKCPRCQKAFIPEWRDSTSSFDRCCPTCQLRNLADCLELPELYDQTGIPRDEHSK